MNVSNYVNHSDSSMLYVQPDFEAYLDSPNSAVTFSDPFFLCSVGINLATRWQVNFFLLGGAAPTLCWGLSLIHI